MNRSLYAVPVLALALVGCSTSKASPAAAPSQTPPATSSPAAVVSPAASATPLSFYAAQYLRLIKPANDALNALQALPSTSTDADYGAAAAKIAPVYQAVDAALLRAQWPANVMVDIKALVTADGAVIGDLSNLTASTVDTMVRDSGTASAQSNIVRADLGLPPVS